MPRFLFGLGCAVIAAAWAILWFSSAGVLYASEIRPPSAAGGQAAIACSYFTGLGTVTREYWHSPTGVMGRDVCPRLINFSQ